MPEYKTTKEQCEANINGVCAGCGGKVEAMETVDNSGDPTYWSGCHDCNHFENGTDQHVFNIASKMVEQGYVEYPHMDRIDANSSDEEKRHFTTCQTRGTCRIVGRILMWDKELSNDS